MYIVGPSVDLNEMIGVSLPLAVYQVVVFNPSLSLIAALADWFTPPDNPAKDNECSDRKDGQ
ncbi:hypothetical protein HMPREF9104_00054 [Lentilactobacillus kisonensis F0435]|uniref:Uncharacterized protein n=1 Tax=Lentilactobacillus kisonensis F0435 TaxID=797516 RepID=H1LBU3_9LACO|nr:hypothetical protein HMPREF9104_00054 [Lentilactobacillus kisonensis F0435]